MGKKPAFSNCSAKTPAKKTSSTISKAKTSINKKIKSDQPPVNKFSNKISKGEFLSPLNST